MKQCPVCHLNMAEDNAVCPRCNTDVSKVPPTGFVYTPPAYTPPTMPYQGIPAPSIPPWMLKKKRMFSWSDVSTILGFCSSILGFLGASFLLFPLGLVTSVLGFRGNNTRKLAIAGIVISTLGLLIKIVLVLQDTQLLPPWLTNGI